MEGGKHAGRSEGVAQERRGKEVFSWEVRLVKDPVKEGKKIGIARRDRTTSRKVPCKGSSLAGSTS